MKNIYLAILLIVLAVFKLNAQDTNTVTDLDGNIYKTITYGSQVWMQENLRTTTYNDSTHIHHITDRAKWGEVKTGAFCYYNHDDKKNRLVYGALYNWFAVNTKKLCPGGWHVPSDEEWKTLEMHLGMSRYNADLTSYRGTDEGQRMKDTGTVQAGTGLWHTPNEGANNESGFTGLPGGFVYYRQADFYGIGSYGFWWSSSDYSNEEAWYRLLYYHSEFISRSMYNKNYGFSVRCIKD